MSIKGALFFDDVNEAKEKETGEEIEHPVSSECAAGAASEQLEKSVAGEAEAEAVGDGPGEWNGGNGKEGGDGDLGVVPFDLAEAGEQDAGDDGGDAGASSGGDPGGGFDVAGDGAGAGERAEDGGGGVGEEDAVEAGDGVVGGDEA